MRTREIWLMNSRDKEHQFVSCVCILKYLIKLLKAHVRFISCFLTSKQKHTRSEKGYEFLSNVLIMWPWKAKWDRNISYGKTGELPTSLPMGCTWATEWAARELPMGILPCKLGCPLLPYMNTVGSSVGSGVGCPWEFCHANKAAHYFDIRIKWATQWSAHYFQVWNKWAVQWAAHLAAHY